MVVREIYARLGIKVDKSSVSGAKTMFTELRSQLELAAQAARAVGSVIQGLIGQTVDYAKEINQLARETGLSRDSIQDLAESADESEVSFSTLREGLLRLQKNGFGKADEKLWELVDTFERVKDPAQRAQIAIAHFGKGGQALVPMLAQGREALEGMIAGGREAGTIMRDDALQAALDLHVGLKELKDNAQGLARAVAGPLIKNVVAAVRVFNEWVSVNRKIISDKLGTVLHRASQILRGVWSAARLAMGALDWLAQRFGWASIAVAAFGAAVMFAGKSTLLLSLKWLAIGAIVAIVAEDVEAFLKGQPSLIGDVVAALDRLFAKLSDDQWTKDHPVKAFFLSVLETVVNIRKEWEQAVNYSKNAVMDSWLGKGVVAAADKVREAGRGKAVRAIDPETGLPLDAASADMLAGYYTAQRQGIPAERPGWQQGLEGGIRRGATAAAGAVQGTFAPSVAVTVNAQTGADPTQIANATARAVQEQLATQIRQARGALVPTPAGAK